MTTTTSPYRAIAKPIARWDAGPKVQGEAKYAGDLWFEGMLYGAVLRSPHDHAHLLSIDLSGARACPGVVAVLTASDILGRNAFGVMVPDQPILAFEKVRFQGEAIAVIVARTEEIARQALKRIKVSYQMQPAVFDPEIALREDAPLVHSDGNLLSHRQIHVGDINAGFATADLVLEATFRTQTVDHAYLEPEVAVAICNNDQITVWAPSQNPFKDQEQIAQALNLPLEQIRVINPAIGGSFGGKDDIALQIMAALAAYQTRRPVRFVNTREESVLSHPKRHAATLYYKVGATTQGRLTALQATIFANTGAYASFGPGIVALMAEMASGPYHIPHIAVDTYCVYTNCLIAGAMRGFGVPQVNFACESIIDMLAERLSIDPLEIRQRNIWRKGDTTSTGIRLKHEVGLAACLEMAERERRRLAARYKEKSRVDGKRYGFGLACSVMTTGFGFGIPDEATARIDWSAKGGVQLCLGGSEMGQGSVTAMIQIAAEELGLDYDEINVIVADTAQTPKAGTASASRLTYVQGSAVLLAAREAKANLLAEASRILRVQQEGLTYTAGVVWKTTAPEQRLSSEEIVHAAQREGRSVSGIGHFTFPYPAETKDTFGIGLPHVVYSYGTQVAVVEVAPRTGKVIVREISAIHEAGRIINPATAAGQIEGGVLMGVGYALYEEVRRKGEGWVINLSEYIIPTSIDAPEVQAIFVEGEEPTGPFGAKGLGEIGTVATAAAIANAIKDATGVRLQSLPMTAEALFIALQEENLCQ
ncbi:MAG: xanthine dehydrogenase family protein molybdopterin-binding subunit [Chloroflexi bacterium]|nr:xanthine dehydrogenase family protein molybdopterin-binding subunit [Chloroflexota bacterium]MCL5076468.1 xanthine dehydrogenase family protein molybdopterin-binding subunit [Chloroflexota bacterium]